MNRIILNRVEIKPTHNFREGSIFGLSIRDTDEGYEPIIKECHEDCPKSDMDLLQKCMMFSGPRDMIRDILLERKADFEMEINGNYYNYGLLKEVFQEEFTFVLP